MRYIFLLITFIFLLNFSRAQTVIHQNWTLERSQQSGSFYWGTSRTQFPDMHGKYYYYVYFYSNSYLNARGTGSTYEKASTYIRNVNVYMEEYRNVDGWISKYNTVLVNLPYYACDWVHDPNHYVAYFVSYSPFNKFLISYERASVYDYSIR